MDEIQLFACDFIAALDTPIKTQLLALIKESDWGGLSVFKVDPSSFLDSESYFHYQQSVEAFRKLEPSDAAPHLGRNALAGWKADEQLCFLTNRRLYPILDKHGDADERASRFFRLVRKEMGNLIGLGPSRPLAGRFGPGTTSEHRGERCLVPDKLCSYPEMTKNAWPFGSVFLLQNQIWARAASSRLFTGEVLNGTFKLVKGNRWSSVPKDVTKDRSIGIEPTLNLWYQLGVGSEFRRKLQKHGLLKSKGLSEIDHRRLARVGSIDGKLATIDLSSASDTISSSIVRLCVPPRWLEVLEDLRSPFTVVKGVPYRLEKFSSMGNGFTFELETALFAAITRVVARSEGVSLRVGDNFGVYGDDIIVPVELDPVLRKALSFCGFKLNDRKSFSSGPFRESCGGDFFLGVDVRPVYFKKRPTQPAEWYPWLNMVRRLIPRIPNMQPVWDKWVQRLPVSLRICRGPESLGDIVLHDPEPQNWLTRRRFSGNMEEPNDWMAIRAVLPVAEKLAIERWPDDPAVAALVYGCSSDGVAPRNSIRGYRTRWVAYG